jgi:hypothetical protein
MPTSSGRSAGHSGTGRLTRKRLAGQRRSIVATLLAPEMRLLVAAVVRAFVPVNRARKTLAAPYRLKNFSLCAINLGKRFSGQRRPVILAGTPLPSRNSSATGSRRTSASPADRQSNSASSMLIAGALRMPVRQFYIANVLSAFIWAPAHVFPGLLIATWATATNASTWQIVVLVVALILVGWLASRVARSYFDRGIVRWLFFRPGSNERES